MMRSVTKNSTAAAVLAVCLTHGATTTLAASTAAGGSAPATTVAAEPADRLDAARLLIFDRNWPGAVAELRRVLEAPGGPLRDEAMFWLAHSLFQLGQAAGALDAIDALQRQYPQSRWVLPAQSLRVEIAVRNNRDDLLWHVATPPAPPAPPPPPALAAPRPPSRPASSAAMVPLPPSPPITWMDIRIQALSGLIRRDPGRAVPVLREIVMDAPASPQARRAVVALGVSSEPTARHSLMQFAEDGPESLRIAAVSQLARSSSNDARQTVTRVYASGSSRMKWEVLRSLAAAGADRHLIALARDESDRQLRGYAVAQLRHLDTAAARAFLLTVK